MTATCSLSKDIFFFFDLTINLFTHEKKKIKKRFHFLNLKKTYNFPLLYFLLKRHKYMGKIIYTKYTLEQKEKRKSITKYPYTHTYTLGKRNKKIRCLKENL